MRTVARVGTVSIESTVSSFTVAAEVVAEGVAVATGAVATGAGSDTVGSGEATVTTWVVVAVEMATGPSRVDLSRARLRISDTIATTPLMTMRSAVTTPARLRLGAGNPMSSNVSGLKGSSSLDDQG